MDYEKKYKEALEKEATSWAGSSAIDAFEAGAEWQKGQMMKDAVEGRIVNINSDFNDIALKTDQFRYVTAFFNDGDKVKIIIVKED